MTGAANTNKKRCFSHWTSIGQAHICHYCKRELVLTRRGTGTSPTVDHVVAVCMGGEHSKENLVPACFNCNHRKEHYLPTHILGGQWCCERHARYYRQLVYELEQKGITIDVSNS